MLCIASSDRHLFIIHQNLSQWLKNDMDYSEKILVEWLPLALFDSHARFVLVVKQLCLDVGISGDALRVTRTGGQGEFRAVGFGSAIELECYLRLEIRRALMEV